MEALDNLVKINQLKVEAADAKEYEGHLDVNPQLLKELISISQEILILVKALAPIE